jgi:hypothetical protein
MQIVHVLNDIMLILVYFSILFLFHPLWYVIRPQNSIQLGVGLNGVIQHILYQMSTRVVQLEHKKAKRICIRKSEYQ